MQIISRKYAGVAPWVCFMGVLGFAAVVTALPPSPPNDDPADAEVLDPSVPTVVFGTTVLANDSISSTTLPPPVDDVDGPDVYYSFTPAVSDTYRFHLFPWQRAPLRSSDRRFILYVLDDESVPLAGAEASTTAVPVSVDVALTAGSTYLVGVDHDAGTHDNFEFTLVVDTLSVVKPEDCASVEDLGTALPYAVLNDIDEAADDFGFVQGTGRCAVSGASPTTAPGPDHVYRFTPAVSGDYAFELGVNGFDGVLYVNTSCPPVFPGGCLGASNHSTSGSSGGKHELIVVTLSAGTDYYVYVDTGAAGAASGRYALLVDEAFGYEINEVEPNDAFSSATPLTVPLNGGQLVGPTDEDYWSVTGVPGDRVYAWVNNGGSSNSTLDTDLALLATDGSTLIEFDDEDGDGADAPIEDLRFIYATSSPVLAGARLTGAGDHYLRVTDQSATGTVHRYRMHHGLIPGTRAPLAECEPNDDFGLADQTGKHFYSGVIDSTDDIDFYAFDVTAGQRVFIAADGDPERDSTGADSANTDPLAFHPKLVIYDNEGDVLISDISDSNSIQSAPDYPAQGGYFVARSSGRHYVSVEAQSSASQVGPTETYELAVFIDEAAPSPAEDTDPTLDLVPDFLANTIAVTASDSAVGDSGVCAVELTGATNLTLTDVTFTPGDAVASFTVALTNDEESGFGKLRVTDCEGNTACAIAKIDVFPPMCDGSLYSERIRTARDLLHVPDNQPGGPGVESAIVIGDAGSVIDVNVTITIETIRPPDIDCFLVSPEGTVVELITDRGSSLAFDITEATFDDDAEEIMPILSGDAPYTGTWLPEDPGGLAQLIGESAAGDWRLRVIDDSSSANGGARLVEWTLDLRASFAGPETFSGTVTDTQGFDCGIASIELTSGSNVALALPPGFQPGDVAVDYEVVLIDPTIGGSATVTVTDLAENTCVSNVSLNGLADVVSPDSDGAASTRRRYAKEVQIGVPGGSERGVASALTVPDSMLVGEVEVGLTIDTEDVGRLAATISHGGAFSALVNRVGMDERGSVGLTKDVIDITLDDDAPQADDAHEEPASGAVEFFGLHQPDGRGAFIGDGITTDDRDNMLFTLAGQEAMGNWTLFVGDFRVQGASSAMSVFRRWSMSIDSPCAGELYSGTAIDLPPGLGVCDLVIGAGSSNLQVGASYAPGDAVVDYEVTLVDEALPGTGTLEIEDCAGNVTVVPIDLAAATGDAQLPLVGGAVNTTTAQFEGTATDDQPGDTGVALVELAPFSVNLELVSVTPDPPNGAASVDFVVGLIDPGMNGRGYVRVTDGCGLRDVVLVELDATGPVCSGAVSQTKRYISGDTPLAIPDNAPGGVLSTIVVPDTDVITDLNVTINITHPFDDDITAQLLAGPVISLWSEIGSTGNDFIDTTIDDEAAGPMPDSSAAAPFTGSWQPENGPALFALDGTAADGAYSLRVLDDTTFNVGSLESWALTIESDAFPQRYDGRAEDGESLASGICDISLLPGAVNAILTVDPFTAGDAIVRYSVELDCGINDGEGSGTVRVTDCAGNTCDVPVALTCASCPEADAPLADGTPGCVTDGDCANEAGCIDGTCYVPKNRYLTLLPGNAGMDVALRVTHVDSGRQWWASAPNVDGVSALQDTPVYRDWSDTPVLGVADCAIAPGYDYEVQAISVDCDVADEGLYSPALTLFTPSTWGDVVGEFVAGAWQGPNGTANFVDIQASVQRFQSVATAPSNSWVDVSPETPNQVTNFEDIQRVVQAFQSLPYPFTDPSSCP